MSAQPVPPLPPEVLLTPDEFLALPEGEGKRELHDGRVAERVPTAPHGEAQSFLAEQLRSWCRRHHLTRPVTELACRLASGRVVVPDVAYVQDRARWQAAWATSALDGAPDLAVEILSPTDTPTDVRQKLQWYMQNNCPLIWVIDPQRRAATLYARTADGTYLTRLDASELEGHDVLPGFRLALRRLWRDLDAAARGE
jgi:Uma2 family endonuclease